MIWSRVWGFAVIVGGAGRGAGIGAQGAGEPEILSRMPHAPGPTKPFRPTKAPQHTDATALDRRPYSFASPWNSSSCTTLHWSCELYAGPVRTLSRTQWQTKDTIHVWIYVHMHSIYVHVISHVYIYICVHVEMTTLSVCEYTYIHI